MTGSDWPLSVQLAGSLWMWRDVAVRGAGSPVDDLLRLGQPKLAEDADADADGFRVTYDTAVAHSCAVLAEIVDSDPFRAALLWQNRKLVGWVLEPWLTGHRAGAPRNKSQRQHEVALTKYAQRYHAKNESIGFFGPVGWARWADDERSAFAVRGRHGEIVERRVQFEHWAVQAIADRFSADPLLRPYLTPVLAPTVRVADGKVWSAVRGWFEMPRPRLDVLALCDGTRTVAEITDRLLAAGVPGVSGHDDVQRVLSGLERAGQVSVGMAVPPTCHPDRYLRRRLEAIPDAGLRQRALDLLDGVSAAAERVRAAAGDPVALDSAFRELAGAFAPASGRAPERPADDTHATGRAVLVEDCRSAVDIDLPLGMRDDLAAPLDLVLTSARWMVDRVATRYLAILGDIHRTMARGADRVGLAAVCYEFWPRCAADVVEQEMAPDMAELRRHWAEIIAVPDGVSRHRAAAVDIAAAVRQRFAAPPAQWLSGRFHCPDVMIAASDVEAVSRGEYEWVLGELHSGQNSLNQGVFMLSHPDPARARAMATEDARRVPGLVPIFPASWPMVSGRSYPPPYLASDAYEYLRFAAEPPRDGVPAGVPISALSLVRDRHDDLWVEAEDGRFWHPLAVLGDFLLDGVGQLFHPFAAAAHRPRIAIDRLVVSREQWTVPVAEVSWAGLRDEADRYRAVRRWADALGLPRYVFVRVAGQAKPYYVDLTSPLLISMIAASVRAAARTAPDSAVTVTEMYPGPDEVWLPSGDAGERCTSELRIAVVDRG
ncbi:lantibiotic dehydratase [Micromonospora sp. NPDC049044]|uniref:lantibiotic dehydratase n=1 Tax=unclassified Micromonospora TaxID=2617518 RepID=UPI0033C830E4